MRRVWYKYIKENKKDYGDCQLVTALNAYYYLTGDQYCKQGSDKYEELVNLTGCRSGSATNIERAYRKLGIEIIWVGNHLLSLTQLADGKIALPLEWNVWDWGYGFHSTLIVEFEPRSDCIRVTNFKKVTDSFGWMFRKDMHKYSNFSIERDHRLFRLFGLKGDPWNQSIKRLWRKEEKRWFTMMRDLYDKKLKSKPE